MRATIISLRATFSLILTTMLALGIWCMSVAGQNKLQDEPEVPNEYAYTPILTEILPFPAEGDSPWIEFYNPLEKEVDASGLTVVINDVLKYSISAKLPPVPPKGFVVLQFDGKGEEANTYEYEENTAILHSSPEYTKALGPGPGQVAIYQAVDQRAGKLVGFVSWGAPGSKKSLTVERDRIWKSRWFVNMAESFGDYDPRTAVKAGYSIGLYPGSRTAELRNWVAYSSSDATPGKENVVPRPGMFTLSDGAEVLSEDIAIGWSGTIHAKEYQFQLAKDAEFRSIMEDKTSQIQLFKPEEELPEGVYYYRVRAIDKLGRKSAWSKSMKLVSKKMASGRGNTDGTIAEKILVGMVHKYQRKDTSMLCIDGCTSEFDATTTKHWDSAHPNAVPVFGDHGDMNCVRASISMMVSYYGGKSLSQDRIAYYTEEERTGVGDGVPEGDLAHSVGMSYHAEETAALEWALDETTHFVDWPNPTFADLRGWLDADRPIMTRTPGHLRTMDGYRIDDAEVEWVHILDPWTGPRWETYTTWDGAAQGTWVGPVSAPNAREDEAGVSMDSDADGIVDFDEQVRFLTGRFDEDSDNDSVSDKNDIREYVFNSSDDYSKRTADFDVDGVRKENDPDNDADTFNDGCEDSNFNGKYEPGLGESNNFAASAGLTCGSKPIHVIIVFDRSGSMVYPPSDPVKKYDEAASAATLFLDTWLANSPPANTKVGLVFYDHNAYFDTNAATDTTLELLNETKRDKIDTSFASNRPSYGSTSIGGGLTEAMGVNGFNIPSVPAEDQHRVVVVLTDGKENATPYMDSVTVTQGLADGKVDGYVLGIGDATQIDATKLNSLADILNHYPASLAKDLDASELQKFFLQILAETQGLEFSVDPPYEIALGETKSHEVPVSHGTERITFVVVWHEPNVELGLTLVDPDGNVVRPDVTKANTLYKVAAKKSPQPGNWIVKVSDKRAASDLVVDRAKYSLMVLEKNDSVSSHFVAKGKFYQIEDPILLVANLARDKKPLIRANVVVEFTRPRIGVQDFIQEVKVAPDMQFRSAERSVKMTPLEQKCHLIAQRGLKIPVVRGTLRLNDLGENGDEIPGDGKYSGYFRYTGVDGVYTFRFMARDTSDKEKLVTTREKTLSIVVGKP